MGVANERQGSFTESVPGPQHGGQAGAIMKAPGNSGSLSRKSRGRDGLSPLWLYRWKAPLARLATGTHRMWHYSDVVAIEIRATTMVYSGSCQHAFYSWQRALLGGMGQGRMQQVSVGLMGGFLLWLFGGVLFVCGALPGAARGQQCILMASRA